MAINTGKVVAGGIAAGVVINVIDFVVHSFVLQERMKAEMDAVSPSLSMAMDGTTSMVAFIVCGFVLGILLVWVYAAMRPRFGPGSGTAVKAALTVWLPSSIAWSSWSLAGVISWNSYAMAAVAGLVTQLIAANVGAMIYTEN